LKFGGSEIFSSVINSNPSQTMRQVRIGTISFLLEDSPHTVQFNLQRAEAYIRQAAERGCDVVCLPEMFRTLKVKDRESEPEELGGETWQLLSRLAATLRMNIIGAWYVSEGGKTYNQATVFDRSGAVAGHYRKAQPTGGEMQAGITAGSQFPVIELDIGKVAVMICMDIYFPEIPRIYAHKGAEILFWPTVSLGPTQEGLLAQMASRAIDNGLWIVESNLANHPPYAPYSGRFRPGTARIMDFNGDVLAWTGRRGGLAVADVDLDEERLTSWTVLLREPDCFRQDLQSITRLDLFAKEYAAIAERQSKAKQYFEQVDE
jgi:predicted amidohydrolase